MKKMLSTVLSLLLDQFIAVISACMMFLPTVQFMSSLWGYALAFAVCFGFYAYTTYLTAFKAGFHDSNRIQKTENYRAFLYKGAILGAISAIPLLIVVLLYFFVASQAWYGVFFIDMYWVWPLRCIFPNHLYAVVLTAFIPMVFVPWVAYIAGFKNIMVSDWLIKLYKKFFIFEGQNKK